MSIRLESTTDTVEQVKAATGSSNAESVEDKKQSATDEKSSVESKSEESETTEKVSEQEESMDDESDSSDESSEQKPKKKGGFQKRIDKLSARVSAAEQRALAAEAALLARQEPAAKETPKSERQPDGKPNPDDFETNADYIDAVTEWKLSERDKKVKADAENERKKTEAQKQAEAFHSKVSDFQKEHGDFDEVIESCEVDLSKDLQKKIVESELAPNLMYELSKNPDEIERLNKLSGDKLVKALAVIEYRLASNSEQKTKEPKKQTKAPAPVSSIGASSAAASKHPDDMSYDEYKKWRASGR